jgi:hypothetical protein
MTALMIRSARQMILCSFTCFLYMIDLTPVRMLWETLPGGAVPSRKDTVYRFIT